MFFLSLGGFKLIDMETRAFKKRCKTVGCPNLHNNKNGYCNECNAKYYATHPSRYEKTRPSSVERGYDSRWHKFAKNFLKDHPVCAMCGAPAQCVDHKDIPADVMMSVYGEFDLDPVHYQALCSRCNTIKGRYEDKRARESYERDKKWIETQGEG